MKISGLSCITKKIFLVFLGHPNMHASSKSTNKKLTINLIFEGGIWLRAMVTQIFKSLKAAHWICPFVFDFWLSVKLLCLKSKRRGTSRGTWKTFTQGVPLTCKFNKSYSKLTGQPGHNSPNSEVSGNLASELKWHGWNGGCLESVSVSGQYRKNMTYDQ